MLAAQFEDGIAGLQKWPFLAFFPPFLAPFFIVTHIYGQIMHMLQKDCLQMSFLGREHIQTFYTPFLKGPHRLLNWQIQVTRVS